MGGDQLLQHLDDPRPVQRRGDVDGQALACKLVRHRQNLQPLAVGTHIMHEIVGPHVVRGLRLRQFDILPQSPSFLRPAAGHTQLLVAPEPMDALMVHAPLRLADQGVGAAIAVARILAGNRPEPLDQQAIAFVALQAWAIALTGATDAAERATAAEREAAGAEMLDGLTPHLRTYHFWLFED